MHDKIINDILDWIEDNLTKPISTIDVIKNLVIVKDIFKIYFCIKQNQLLLNIFCLESYLCQLFCLN
ncbi:right origin-binding protein [Proteus mirabilis]|nr:right origin-binding protein [Proteus mirabilis]